MFTRPGTDMPGFPALEAEATALRPVLLNAYGRAGLADRRWRDISLAIPQPSRGWYRLIVVEMPIGAIRIWHVDRVERDDASTLLRDRARRLLDTEDFGSERVRLAVIDGDGLDVVGRLRQTLAEPHRWAITVEPRATLDSAWTSDRRHHWTRATLNENQADRSGTQALIAVHQVIGMAERLTP